MTPSVKSVTGFIVRHGVSGSTKALPALVYLALAVPAFAQGTGGDKFSELIGKIRNFATTNVVPLLTIAIIFAGAMVLYNAERPAQVLPRVLVGGGLMIGVANIIGFMT